MKTVTMPLQAYASFVIEFNTVIILMLNRAFRNSLAMQPHHGTLRCGRHDSDDAARISVLLASGRMKYIPVYHGRRFILFSALIQLIFSAGVLPRFKHIPAADVHIQC